MFADMFEKDTKVEEMFGSFGQNFYCFNESWYSQALNCIFNELINKLAFTFKDIFVNLSNERINHFFEVDNNFIQQRETIILVGVSLTYSKYDIHGLIDVRS